MYIDEWRNKVGRKEINRRIKLRMKSKFFRPDFKHPERRWVILDRKACKNTVILLCLREESNDDYGVFIDYLAPGFYPSDKFYGTLKDAKSAFRETEEPVYNY